MDHDTADVLQMIDMCTFNRLPKLYKYYSSVYNNLSIPWLSIKHIDISVSIVQFVRPCHFQSLIRYNRFISQ